MEAKSQIEMVFNGNNKPAKKRKHSGMIIDYLLFGFANEKKVQETAIQSRRIRIIDYFKLFKNCGILIVYQHSYMCN